MLTMKGIFEDGVVYFLGEVPVNGARQVLVTFLDDELGRHLVVPKHQLDRMLILLKEGKVLLSKRQIQVLELAKQGLTNAEIAEKLGIYPGSVGNHLTNIYRLLEVKNRSEAITKAIEYGII